MCQFEEHSARDVVFLIRLIYARNVTRLGEHPRMRTKLEAASALAVFITGFSAGKEKGGLRTYMYARAGGHQLACRHIVVTPDRALLDRG
jgi:hypothetical protein